MQVKKCGRVVNNDIFLFLRYDIMVMDQLDTRRNVSMMKYPDESLCVGKDGTMNENGDHIFNSQHFKAVFDGATPKGKRLWEGVPGDVYASRVLCEAMRNVEPSVSPSSLISYLNDVIKKCYAENGVSFEELPPEERLQVSAIIHSVHRREVWCFGDCSVKINNVLYKHTRAGDKLLSDLRAFYTELYGLKNVIETGEDPGREAILPLLKEFPVMANQAGEFGYDVINGGDICTDNIVIYHVKPGDRIVLASDGYPALFDTLEETEKYLFQLLDKDPLCIHELRGTKRLINGNQSFDDRSYISFYV